MNQLFISTLQTSVRGSDTILQTDPYGLIVAGVSISVVILALIVLAIFIALFSRGVMMMAKYEASQNDRIKDFREATLRMVGFSSRPKKAKSKVATPKPMSEDELISGEIVAAITLVLNLNSAAMHDRESEVVTINKVARVYSPWSSKSHSLTQMPR